MVDPVVDRVIERVEQSNKLLQEMIIIGSFIRSIPYKSQLTISQPGASTATFPVTSQTRSSSPTLSRDASQKTNWERLKLNPPATRPRLLKPKTMLLLPPQRLQRSKSRR
jgi:hypothetical protein